MVIDSLDNVEIKKLILQFIGDSPVYICGVSALGRVMSQWMDFHGIEYEGFVDRKGRADWTDKDVLTYEDIYESKLYDCKFIVTQKLFRCEVEEDLLRSGVSRQCILQFKDDASFDCLYNDLLQEQDCLKDVSRFKNKYYGERCFVVGNGPSLLEKDIAKIKNEYNFAVNMMYENFERLRWKPSFYVIIDRVMSKIFEDDELLFRKTIGNIEWFFAEYKTGLYAKYHKEKPENLIFFKDITKRIGREQEYSFSDDMEKGIYRGQSVVYDVLQMAVYMGFKKIYLIGVDMNYQRERNRNGSTIDNFEIKRNHAVFVSEPDFYENDAYEPVDEMLLGYEAAKKYSEKHSVEIYNATRGGKLEIFQRVEFDELFKE